MGGKGATRCGRQRIDVIAPARVARRAPAGLRRLVPIHARGSNAGMITRRPRPDGMPCSIECPNPRQSPLRFLAAGPHGKAGFKVMSRLGRRTSEVFLCFDEFHRPGSRGQAHQAGSAGRPIDGPLFARFFAAEAALVGRLKHPHVVQIFDAITRGPRALHRHGVRAGQHAKLFCRSDNLAALEVVVEIGFKCAKGPGIRRDARPDPPDIKPANILPRWKRAIKEGIRLPAAR